MRLIKNSSNPRLERGFRLCAGVPTPSQALENIWAGGFHEVEVKRKRCCLFFYTLRKKPNAASSPGASDCADGSLIPGRRGSRQRSRRSEVQSGMCGNIPFRGSLRVHLIPFAARQLRSGETAYSIGFPVQMAAFGPGRLPCSRLGRSLALPTGEPPQFV
jgi:hypothetical protein